MHLIEDLIKVKNEAVLIEIESVLKRAAPDSTKAVGFPLMTLWVYGARKMPKPSKRPLKTDVSKFIPMTGNRFALDTNIVSAWLKGEISIADKIDSAESAYFCQ